MRHLRSGTAASKGFAPSLSRKAGLIVGDMILAVNKDTLLGSDYDSAASLLKKTEGMVSLVVCNPNKVKEDEKKAAEAGATVSSSISTPHSGAATVSHSPKDPEKPKLLPKPQLSSLKPQKPPPPKSIHAMSPNSGLPTFETPVTPPTSSNTSGLCLGNPLPLATMPVSPSASPSSTLRLSPLSVAKHQSTTPEEPPPDPSKCEISPGKETTVEINKDKMGLGLSIVGGSDTLLGVIIIHEVYPDGAAAKDGRLKPGDQILEVNSEDFRNITHSKALAALRQTPAKVKMVVFRDEASVKEEDMFDVMEVELTKKPGKGLGLSIVGRKNGNGVFISDVVRGGTAEADGRLMKGDQILAVNGQDLKSATQEEAAAVLKTAMGKVTIKLGRLKAGSKRNSNIDRSSNLGPQLQTRTVILERGPDGLGFSIVGGHCSPHGDLPIYVKTVFEKGAAAHGGQLHRGDQIVAVNSVSLEGLTHQEAVAVLKRAQGNVTLTIQS